MESPSKRPLHGLPQRRFQTVTGSTFSWQGLEVEERVVADPVVMVNRVLEEVEERAGLSFYLAQKSSPCSQSPLLVA